MSGTFVNAVYYPSWRVYAGKPPSALQLQPVTHVLYAFLRVNADGTLRYLDEWGDLKKPVDGETECIAAFAKMKRRNPHVKTLISIGGGSGSDEFPTLAESSSARQKFARQVRDFCDRHHFDGVDIDWEHPTTPTHGQNYLKLLIDVRAQLSTPKYLLTTALPTGEYCLRNIDLCCASQYLDFLNLMGYDFTGPWTEVAGHHAQLHEPKGSLMKSAHPELKKSCSRGVEDVLKTGFPCNKILLGIPAYARYFPKAVAAGQPSQNVAGEIDYCDLPGHWPKEATIDKELRAASFVDEEKGFVSFDVPATVALKARYANQMRLGGLFFWTGVGDRCDDMSLVEAGHCGLLTRYEP